MAQSAILERDGYSLYYVAAYADYFYEERR